MIDFNAPNGNIGERGKENSKVQQQFACSNQLNNLTERGRIYEHRIKVFEVPKTIKCWVFVMSI